MNAEHFIEPRQLSEDTIDEIRLKTIWIIQWQHIGFKRSCGVYGQRLIRKGIQDGLAANDDDSVLTEQITGSSIMCSTSERLTPQLGWPE